LGFQSNEFLSTHRFAPHDPIMLERAIREHERTVAKQ
jgi:hypothetical protein